MANQSFRFNQTQDAKVDKLWISTGNLSGVNNSVLGVGQSDFANGTLGTLLNPLDQDDRETLLTNVLPNGSSLRQANDQTQGMTVSYSGGTFSISSGTTGDSSSLKIENASTLTQDLLGMTANAPSYEVKAQLSLVNNLLLINLQVLMMIFHKYLNLN